MNHYVGMVSKCTGATWQTYHPQAKLQSCLQLHAVEMANNLYTEIAVMYNTYLISLTLS